MNFKTNEKTIRLRYIRVLEKFVTKTISLLKYDNFDLELFKTAINKAYLEMDKATKCDLYSEYPQALKSLVDHILISIENHSDDFETEKNSILKQSNLLAKLKNNNRYKKDKHKKKKFTDGY